MTAIEETLHVLSNRLIEIVKEIMVSKIGVNDKTGKNSLADSSLLNTIKPYVKEPFVGFFVNDYIDYIESGRRPKKGKFPPPEVIAQWCDSVGIKSDASTVFLISRAIWRDGISPRPILATLEDKLEEEAIQPQLDNIFEIITQPLEEIFA